MKKKSTYKGICLFLVLSSSVHAFCFEEAAQKYGINAHLLRAIAQTESSMRANIESPTQDIGLMGINRSWLPILNKRFGLTEAHIWEPCINVHVGAWILAHNFNQYGRNWNAIGAYNASCTKLKGNACTQVRNQYSRKIWDNWQKISLR
ncbi:lytic transglycosylase domain-containing protein [Neisseria sp. Ec49-e6-T10]|uniref:lytic transglycosylase domain-containing protein n=1 Tax=Neisseria sp. Ec49-e6-T10 TaxID=3140744 RepID=UPI003EB7F77A